MKAVMSTTATSTKKTIDVRHGDVRHGDGGVGTIKFPHKPGTMRHRDGSIGTHLWHAHATEAKAIKAKGTKAIGAVVLAHTFWHAVTNANRTVPWHGKQWQTPIEPSPWHANRTVPVARQQNRPRGMENK